MPNELKPPTTQAEALRMVEPLNPSLPRGTFTAKEMDIAFIRLHNFITALIPK